MSVRVLTVWAIDDDLKETFIGASDVDGTPGGIGPRLARAPSGAIVVRFDDWEMFLDVIDGHSNGYVVYRVMAPEDLPSSSL